MALVEIKDINIKEYLKQKGVFPKRDYGYYGMYHCPYREDRNASFKVDYNKNVWHDFGTNEGGSIIDLVIRLNNCSFNDALEWLVGDTNVQFSQLLNDCTYKLPNVATSQHSNDDDDFSLQRTQIINIQPINHPKLIT
jgi:DNA primase